MDDIAIGRKEIMKALHIDTWGTIKLWKKKDPGFKKLIHKHPITKRPVLVIKEYIEWVLKCNTSI